VVFDAGNLASGRDSSFACRRTWGQAPFDRDADAYGPQVLLGPTLYSGPALVLRFHPQAGSNPCGI